MILIQIIKIIGIILAILLGIALILLLLVLFVPIRYKGEVSLDKDKDSYISAKANASWLMRIMRVEAVYDEGKSSNAIYLFGRRIKDES